MSHAPAQLLGEDRSLRGLLVRHQAWVQIACVGLILASVWWTSRAVPAERVVWALERLADRPAGWAGMTLAYVVLVVCLSPGSLLTFTCGALLGMARGSVVALAGCTVGAMTAFALSRYVLREPVLRVASRNRQFRAVELLVGHGDAREQFWGVLWVRLSPLIPFNLLNYGLGVTRVRAWPTAAATLVGCAPGTFIWAAVGSAAAQAADPASGDPVTPTGPPRWMLLALGLAVAAVTSLVIARRARRALAERLGEDEERALEAPVTRHLRPSTLVLCGLTLLALLTAAVREPLAAAVVTAFGPPQVAPREVHTQDPPAAATFDHAALAAVLRHVDAEGLVDYAALRADRDDLDAYVASLADAPFDHLTRDGKLAFLLNAYNALVIELVVDAWPIENILKDVDEPFRQPRWTVAGRQVSLDSLRHGWIRAEFDEPRVHWALADAAVSFPPLRQEPYVPGRLADQLADQARRVYTDARFVRFGDGRSLELSSLYRWYASDFGRDGGGVPENVARFEPALAERLAAKEPVEVSYLEFRWEINDVSNRPLLERTRRP